MLSWLGGKLIGHNLRRLRAGDAGPSLAMDAEDVHFRFPGRNSFAPGADGKPELATWLERFTALGLQLHADEIVIQGFPWKQTVCVRGHVHLDDPEDGRVYDNRYVIWGHLRWGKLREYEVYEDTEETARLDEWLQRTGKERPGG